MSLFSWNSFSQPPLTFFASAIELRVSPLTTLYSPSPFLTFLPVGVVTVLVDFFSAAGRSAEREAGCSSVARGAVSVLCEEPEPEYAALDRPVPQCGQAPLPWPARTFSAISICWPLLAWSAVEAYAVPPYAAQVEAEN